MLLLSCVAMIPLAIFMLAAHSFDMRGVVLTVVYLVIAAMAASVSASIERCTACRGSDALNRLTQKTYPDATSVQYTFDLVGKVLQVNDPTGTYGFSYDTMERLTGTSTQYAFLTGTFKLGEVWNQNCSFGPNGPKFEVGPVEEVAVNY